LSRKKIIVLGLGNPLMSDEGIGGFVVERLLEKAAEFEDVDFLDAGVGGISLLHLMADREKVILIDCAYMESEPGTIKRFTPQEVASVKQMAHLSLHEIDILGVIEMARQLGQCPDEIMIFGIEPEVIEQKQLLSDTLMAKVDEYVATVLRAL
jgi:hydrogenase maturation protease